ncbi:MAG: PQQ-dependent sugar dehydrogenase [Myxococcales bacterium]|nr:PQQ-dependent sugar dehydrogenase [Myxococcales bacterium]
MLVFGASERVLVASRGRIDLLSEVSGIYRSEPWVVDLPNGEHSNNGMALGADGFVYFTVGSTCDVCDERDPRSATVMRARSDQSAPEPEVFARGLRNAYDLAFTGAGELLATDNGPECCAGETSGCTRPGADRLLHLEAGGDYGWPAAYRGGGPARALAQLPLHSGATGLTIDDGLLPCADRGSAFLALWGTQHGSQESGRRVLRVRLGRDSAGGLAASETEPFLGPDGLAHPIDVAIGRDGALYILDFEGSVYRVAPTNVVSCP